MIIKASREPGIDSELAAGGVVTRSSCFALAADIWAAVLHSARNASPAHESARGAAWPAVLAKHASPESSHGNALAIHRVLHAYSHGNVAYGGAKTELFCLHVFTAGIPQPLSNS
ncbi:hypothetical protein J2W35_006505 [Variovorax boronicumulans]|uniref:hypothetical protein n=1 Tax=Variovorax boronicumulans TaxID=436515 RepID=UPI00278ADF5D|nr:hypothetical protein [Variovorax boronicumulans]MDQ0086124.1 hypothetical protein [Variovorax boronicumulans]